MEITKEKLIQCGFNQYSKYGENYQMDTHINGTYLRVDFVNGKFRFTTDALQRQSFLQVTTFNRLNCLIYGITGEWLEDSVIIARVHYDMMR